MTEYQMFVVRQDDMRTSPLNV